MNIFAVASTAHHEPTHPENARRVPAILSELDADTQLAGRLQIRTNPEPLDDDALASVHQRAYINALRTAMARAPAYVDHAPTYITAESFTCAAKAAAAAAAAVETASQSRTAAFAIVRPPGHHAPPDHAMGFCLFNNVAIAARRAQQLGHARIMIFDFDVHHGNGTQAAFYTDPSVLFISTHQSGIYPLSGDIDETGAGPGQGATINIPLPAGSGDAAFRSLWASVVQPAAVRFEPDFLLVSAGYDAHWRDPLANLSLSCTGYHWLSEQISRLAKEACHSRLVYVLEGGYDLAGLAQGVRNTIRGTLALPADDPLGAAPDMEPAVSGLLKRVRDLHHL